MEEQKQCATDMLPVAQVLRSFEKIFGSYAQSLHFDEFFVHNNFDGSTQPAWGAENAETEKLRSTEIKCNARMENAKNSIALACKPSTPIIEIRLI